MFKLLEIKDGQVTPTDECLTIYPYCDIYSRDSHIRKDLALRELAYIGFMVNPSDENPFYGYRQDDASQERSEKIIENKFKDYPDWEPDDLVIKGIQQWYEFLENASQYLKFYESNVNAMNKVRDFYDNLDMYKENLRTGVPIYKPKEITDGIKNADEVITKLVSLKKKIADDLYEVSKTKGNKVINPFER